MNISRILKRKAPLMLAVSGAVGVIATAVAAARASPKALDIIHADSRRNHDGDPYAYTIMEAVRSGWKYYIPTIVIGGATIVCIFGSNYLNSRSKASLASAYAALLSAHQKYENKVKELYGREAHEEIMRELAVEKAKNMDISAWTLVSNCSISFEGAEEEPRLFYDAISERYFESTFSKVLEAEYHLNRNYCLGAILYLNDFYEFLGIDDTPYGDTVGWTMNDDFYWIDFNHYHAEIEDGYGNLLDCWVIDAVVPPTAEVIDETCGTKLLY